MDERRKDRSTVRVEAIHKQLEAIARDGELEYIALADEFGYVIGESGGGGTVNPADVERFRKVLTRFRDLLTEQMDLHQVSEASVVRMDNQRLHCRFFEFGDQTLSILTVKHGRDPSSRIMDRVVTGVVRILSAYDMDTD
jgi:hypothetical protein